ncbi:MAG TPA: VCBS repeat-containing protein [Symbiobacteriaceae bacterium]|nr:VCBS repeat-containing protein [Symbiobacteriaceae bacterium]
MKPSVQIPMAAALMLILTACGGVAAKPVPKTEEPIPATVKVSELETVAKPTDLTLSQFTEGLRDLANQDKAPVGPRLTALYEKWNVKPLRHGALVVETDLNNDGVKETVAAYRDPSSANGTGTLFVIYKKGDKFEVDRLQEECIAPAIHGVTDLNQDGRPEILWSMTSVGANTTNTRVFATSWKPGSFERLPGELMTTNMSSLTVEGQEVVLKGNTKGGYGAGTAQRERTDRYRWVDGSLRAVKKEFTPSEFAYHRLQDGLLAEEFGDTDAAVKAFTAAAEPGRPVLPDGDSVVDQWRLKLAEAVRVYSQFRLALRMGKVEAGGAGLLGAVAGAEGREAMCKAATAWAEANPDFVKSLNSPRGYANPQWKAADLCGPLPNF